MIADKQSIERLPAGLAARPVTMHDVESATRLFNQYEKSVLGTEPYEVDKVQSEWQTPGFNIAEDTLSVWTPEGHPVGYVEFWDQGEPHIRISSWGCTHPDFQERGIGSFLMDWLLQRARQNVSKAPEDTRVVLQQSAYHLATKNASLLMNKGFTYIRSFYRMRIDFTSQPPAPVIPQGITLRSIQPGEERRAILTGFESFKDHWGHFDQPFEQYYERWMHFVRTNKDYDPSLWFVAEAGDEVAGISLCYSQVGDDHDMGWVGTLGVLKPWRKQGLGLALLQHSFAEFTRRGKPRAGLGVDASSLTGATRLYERAGMYVERQNDLYEIELRPGKDLITRAVYE